jgi:hypothetical protein
MDAKGQLAGLKFGTAPEGGHAPAVEQLAAAPRFAERYAMSRRRPAW